MLRKDAHLAEKKDMLRIPLGRERVASNSLFCAPGGAGFLYSKHENFLNYTFVQGGLKNEWFVSKYQR